MPKIVSNLRVRLYLLLIFYRFCWSLEQVIFHWSTWYNEQEDDSKFKLLYHFYNYSMVWRSPYGTLWLQTHKDEVNREVLAGEILNLLDYDNWKCLLDAVPKNQKISFFKCQCQKKKKKKNWTQISWMKKKRLWHKCFPVNFAKFLKKLVLQNTSGRLLLDTRK